MNITPIIKKALQLLCCLLCIAANAQNSDDRYAKPLKQVIKEVEQRFHIRIKYADTLIANKQVTYADWRYRQDAETTLEKILAPFDLIAKKESDSVYKLGSFEYHRWKVEDGWAELDRISDQYHNKAEWEARKAELRSCMIKALQLDLAPIALSKPITTEIRKYDGYTVQNIAIEILPGIYVNGSLYKPAKYKGRIPVILCPDGHWAKQRYRADCQLRCASLAKMGAMAFSFDLFAWGESLLQFKSEDHRRSLSMSFQVLGGIRILDYLLSLKDADTTRVGISGGSGGGTHTALLTALDDRIKCSAPVASVSSYFYGGCPCESGMPIHTCAGGTDNVEIAAMAAPRPQLVVSDGKDWTDRMPEHDLAYLKKIYGWYDKSEFISNVHLKEEGHDFGINKRTAVYEFMANRLLLDLNSIKNATGKIDESFVTIEKEPMMYVFGANGERLPANAVKGFENAERLFYQLKRN
jgi:dienelactone hydrolase